MKPGGADMIQGDVRESPASHTLDAGNILTWKIPDVAVTLSMGSFQ